MQQQSPSPLVVAADPADNDPNNFVVAGYLPDYRFNDYNLKKASEHLTDVYLYSLTPQDLSSSCCLQQYHFQQARQAQAYKQEHDPGSARLKIWVTIGGADRCNGFKQIVRQDKETRKLFIDNLIELCHKEGLDGIDFDWEVPQTTESDKTNYYHFLSQASKQLHAANIQISVKLHPNEILPPFLYIELDRIHLMTYDMFQRKGKMPYHASMSSIKHAIKLLTKKDRSTATKTCPSKKIILGIPAYARQEEYPYGVKDFAEIIHGMTQQKGEKAVHLALTNALQEGETKKRIEIGKWNGYLFETRTGIRNKVDYAINNAKLGGVFFWELGQDKQYPHIEQLEGGVLLQAAGEQRKEYVEQVCDA